MNILLHTFVTYILCVCFFLFFFFFLTKQIEVLVVGITCAIKMLVWEKYVYEGVIGWLFVTLQNQKFVLI